MKVLAFTTSSNAESINGQLVNMAVAELQKSTSVELDTVDMNDYELPLYTQTREGESGIPDKAVEFYNKIGEADALIIGLPEHNGYYPAVYKNLFDWTSRHDMQFYQNKPTLLLATSPGPGGAANVLGAAAGSAPFFAMEVKGSMSVPSFYDAVDMQEQVFYDAALNQKLAEVVQQLVA
jgi:NAD(P)H-dependent FMN reductase